MVTMTSDPMTSVEIKGNVNKDLMMPAEDDLLYEEELLRNPFTLKLWTRYLDAKKGATAKRRYLIYERAVKALPGSYKLWYAYLKERLAAVRGMRIDNTVHEAVNNCFERALVTMHKMPKIWELFLKHLFEQKLLTRMRHTCDKALCSLPITQHHRVWTIYLDHVRQDGIPVDTALRVYRRYLQLEPGHAEEYIQYLQGAGHWNECAVKLADLVNDDSFQSLVGKTKHQMWLELCDIITKHPSDIKDLQVDAILRGGIRKFTDEVGRLWTSLADYYIRRALFEQARDVYEEGMQTVTTVRDFSLIFDAYTQFEESMLSAKMEQMGEDEEDEEADPEDDGVDFLLKDDGNDVDLRLARLEYHMERRPELVSSVNLRQNPHNVHEWHKRVKLFEADPGKQILTFTEAVKTVSLDEAIGKPHTLWVAFAKFYEKHGDVPNARVIFEKAVLVPFKVVDDLATVWCEWAEMELRHQNFQESLELMRRATEPPPRRRGGYAKGEVIPSQHRLFKCLKVWMFYCDLEESLGDLESSRAVYDRILELRIATPQIVLNYALLLQENKYFEDSFRIYEKGVAVFNYPHVKEIWQAYLVQFVERYGGAKLERARDLFEQALEKAPPEQSVALFKQYAKLEEEHGLARHAMTIYERAVKRVPEEDKMPVYELYLNRAMEYFGVAKVRQILEGAINSELSDESTKGICLRYAALEKRLGEIDRARALMVHASQLADPLKDTSFWEEWNAFEVKHGNEDTFREMLRIKRSVSASYSTTHMALPSAGAAVATPSEPAPGQKREREDGMAALEQQLEPPSQSGVMEGFVKGGVEGEPSKPGANKEEIDLDDMDEDEEEDGGRAGAGEGASGDMTDVQEMAVPDEVFGKLKEKVEAAAEEGKNEPMGALDRFKKRRVQ